MSTTARLDTAAVRRVSAERHASGIWAEYRHRLPSAAGPPPGWRLVQRGADGAAYVLAAGRHMSVIESVAREADGRVWHHVSIGRKDRDPTWQELIAAKVAFVGDRFAYLVAPPRRYYVSIHPHVLHWFSCLDAQPDGAVLPEFSAGTGSI